MISNEDRELIRKFEDIMRKGRYCNGRQLQTVYNRVFDVTMAATSCGSCLRARTQKLVAVLNKEEADEAKQAEIKAQEALKQEDPTPIKEEIKEEPGNASSLHSNPLEMSTEQKKRGRKPKKEKEE